MKKTYANEALKGDIRIQDIVAKTARVNLRDTVRVLRAMAMVMDLLQEQGATSRINHWLYESAKMGGFPSPLHSKPDAIAIDACDDFYDLIEREYGEDLLKALFELSADPYFANKVSPRHAEGV